MSFEWLAPLEENEEEGGREAVVVEVVVVGSTTTMLHAGSRKLLETEFPESERIMCVCRKIQNYGFDLELSKSVL
jgi:hypothetical protein